MTDKIKKPKQKLELTWIGKDNRPRLEPRILLPDDEHSYHAAKRSPDGDCFDNKLIYGDNLLVLKSLEQDYTGKVKCIYIDPPYNTGNAFEHYDDGLEHSIWLCMMRDRLELLRTLLAEDGSLWISIDADESHYLKVMCDEIFGRKNFVDEVIWQRSYAPINLKKTLSRSHDAILVYSKNSEGFRLNKLPRSDAADARYKNPDNDLRGVWKSGDLSVGPAVEKQIYEITIPSGRKVMPSKGRCWVVSKDRLEEMILDNRIWFGKDGNNVPSVKRFLSEVKDGVVAMTVWTHQDVGHNQDAKREARMFNEDNVFATPKPERLMERIIHIATNEGDIVLDSFAGSGTTGAVAHKMKRKWIMVELGDHCYTHIVPRMKQVVDGTDKGGISESVGWERGGGFRAYKLAPSMLKKDDWGYWIINKEVYNPERLAEAMCKHMGFKYAPDDTHYWMQGYAHEASYIYVTTQTMVAEQLHALNELVGDRRSLLVCCSAFIGADDIYKNLTIKKIPDVVLAACEWARDDYSLRVNNLPVARREATPKTAQDDFFNPEDNNDE